MGWIILVIAITMIYLGYFLIYIPQQESMVNKRGFRILKEYASNIYDKYNYYKSHLENYNEFYILEYLKQQDKPKNLREKINADDQKILRDLLGALEKSIETRPATEKQQDTFGIYYDASRKNYQLIFSKFDSASLRILFDSLSVPKQDLSMPGTEAVEKPFINSPEQTAAADDTNSGKTYLFVKDEQSVIFKESTSSSSANKKTEAGSIQDKKTEKSYSLLDTRYAHRLPFATLLDGLKFDNLLGNITLFNENEVIYNTNHTLVNAITNPQALVDSTEKHQGGVVERLNVGAEENHVMILPIDFHGERFYLAGFISTSKYSDKTRAINSQLLIVVSGLLLLAIIGMPVLKIFFLSKQERLHASDANGSIISIMLGAGVIILLTTNFLKHNVNDHDLLIERLTENSKKLYKNVNKDINRITGIYEDIRKGEAEKNSLARTAIKFFTDTNQADKIYKKIPDRLLEKSFPVNEIFLMDNSGKIFKAVTSTAFYGGKQIDVSQRKYFQNLKNDTANSWLLRARLKNLPETRFFIESIKSYNTGNKEAAISFSLPQDKKELYKAPFLAITSHIPALYDQVLPPDMEFIIINESGKVLFHSIQQKNLHENFLDECDRDPGLLGAIDHRTGEIIKIKYNEKPWLGRIIPIHGTSLYHITLIDLQQTQNKNARILIFTAYFLLAGFIIILAGMFILQLPKYAGFTSSHRWSLNYLLFNRSRSKNYLFLLVLQSFLILLQLAGLFFKAGVFDMFIYQIFFVTLSAFLAVIILNEQFDFITHFFKKEKLTSSLILLALIILLSISWVLGKWHLSLIHSLAFAVIIFLLSGKAKNNKTDKDGKPAGLKYLNAYLQKEITEGTARKVFMIYLFIWLAGISVIPVLQYYDSVKIQEEKIWHRHKLDQLAENNTHLMDLYPGRTSSDWYQRLQGNGMDDLKITAKKTSIEEADYGNFKNIMDFSDSLYGILPDPLTYKSLHFGLLKDTSIHKEWMFYKKKPDTLHLKYERPGSEAKILISSAGREKLPAWKWLLFFSLPIIFVFFLIWVITRYLAGIILRSKIDRAEPSKTDWKEILQSNTYNHVLLITYSGDEYLDKAKKEAIKFYGSHGHSGAYQDSPIRVISAVDLANNKFSGRGLFSGEHKIIWLKDTEAFLESAEDFCRLDPWLVKIINQIKVKLILVLPYDIEFIREKAEDWLADNENTQEQKSCIRAMLNKLNFILKGFYRHSEKLILQEINSEPANEDPEFKNEDDKEMHIKIKYLLKYQYDYIWNKLTKIEKMILYDLADDGLLNTKNKPMINKLVQKGLIKVDSYPELFAKSFQYFILYNIDPEETRLIEKDLIRQGKWRNMRYLIWFMLIPLVGFIFIAQGTSIEKVIGILSGGLAVVAGLMRVLNSGSAQSANAS